MFISSFIRGLIAFVKSAIFGFIGGSILGFVICLIFDIEDDGVKPCFIITCIMATGVLFLLFLIESQCEKCKKVFAMVEISRSVIDEEYTTIDVDRPIRNSKGKIIAHRDETVPAIQTTYKCFEKCEYCGYKRRVDKQETHRI